MIAMRLKKQWVAQSYEVTTMSFKNNDTETDLWWLEYQSIVNICKYLSKKMFNVEDDGNQEG